MSAEAIAEFEQQAGEQAHRVLDLIQSGRREELVAYMNALDHAEMCCVLLAVSQALLDQEARNDEVEVRCGVLTAHNRQLEAGNAALFRERTILTQKVEELRGIVFTRQKRKAS